MNIPLQQSGHGIEWLNCPGTKGQTWNPIVGCSLKTAGCTNCYAMTMARRIAAAADAKAARGEPLTARQAAYRKAVRRDKDRKPLALWSGVVTPIEEALTEPLSWRTPRTVFMSQTDLFHEDVLPEFIGSVLKVMAATLRHTYIILTKRIERAAEIMRYVPRNAFDIAYGTPMMKSATEWSDDAMHDSLVEALKKPLPNLWLGCSVTAQKDADKMIPHLLRCPAAVRVVSYEPATGPVDFDTIPVQVAPGFFGSPLRWHHRGKCHKDAGIQYPTINWLIVGGESGPGARPFDIAWARSAIAQCKAAGVACFVKQLGARITIHNDRMSEWPNDGDGLLYEDAREGTRYQGEPMTVRLRDPKGGDWNEWPADLRVREWPNTEGESHEGRVLPLQDRYFRGDVRTRGGTTLEPEVWQALVAYFAHVAATPTEELVDDQP